MPSLRVLSVRARATGLDRDALARLIESHHPDVACVHGSPSLLRWRSISAALARKAGLVVVGGGRTGGGNLVMSTLGVDAVTTHDLSFAGTSGVRPPGATLAVLRLRGSDFVFAGARLHGSPRERRGQAEELRAAIAGLVPGDQPVLLSVVGADGPEASALADDLVAVTGGLFVDPRIAVQDAQLRDGAALLELVLPDAAVG